MNETSNNSCDGCGEKCYKIGINKDESCPCTFCIVKTMCSEVCSVWIDWHRSQKRNEGWIDWYRGQKKE